MLRGHLIGGGMLLVDGSGLPVVETEPPEAPAGYTARPSWVEAEGAVTQVWSLVPDGGTVADAVERLARMQAEGLPDAEAAKVPLLFPEWTGDGAAYVAGDRVCYAGTLYRCLQAHTSRWGWDPADAPSLWAAVLPGQDGAVGEWVQPDSTNGYSEGDRVTHGGKLWESTADNNVWEPGTTGAPWREVDGD